ncbi:MAG: hypothetical protein WBF06_00560 [Candidatus Acidiferrales bacterium]
MKTKLVGIALSIVFVVCARAQEQPGTETKEPDSQTQNVNTNTKTNTTATTNPPVAAKGEGQCLIVGSEHKGKWVYRDSYNLDPQNVEVKYTQSELADLMKRNVHVIILNKFNYGNKQETNARIACQGQVPQR